MLRSNIHQEDGHDYMRLLRHLVEDAIHLCRSRDRPSRNFLFAVPPPKTHPLSPQGLLFPWNHSSENALANMPGTPPITWGKSSPARSRCGDTPTRHRAESEWTRHTMSAESRSQRVPGVSTLLFQPVRRRSDIEWPLFWFLCPLEGERRRDKHY